MEIASGNIFIRKMIREKGGVIPGHTHNFDHTTIFFRGRFHVSIEHPNGRVVEREITAPHHLLVARDDKHTITFLEDGEAWCVYSHRSPQGEVVQEDNGWYSAYV